MQKTYTYKGNVYTSEDELREAIFKNEGLVFSVEPNEKKAEFWQGFGVEYREIKPSLAELKAEKLKELHRAFSRWRNDGAYLFSSIDGMKVDSDQRAMIDVSGLVSLDSAAVFMDADNVPHELTAEQLKQLQKEIVLGGNFAYQQKWEFRTKINAAKTKTELDKIELVFLPFNAKEAK